MRWLRSVYVLFMVVATFLMGFELGARLDPHLVDWTRDVAKAISLPLAGAVLAIGALDPILRRRGRS